MPSNQVTIHSRPGCLPGVGPEGETGQRTGQVDCGAGNGDVGCGVFHVSPDGYGLGFNTAPLMEVCQQQTPYSSILSASRDGGEGGVYALSWEKDAIKVWHWQKCRAPLDIESGDPDPSTWGQPVANWIGCDFGNYFRQMNMVW